MPKVMKKCKACGKMYQACATPSFGTFRWRDVACSLECAEKWFAQVEEARRIAREKANASETAPDREDPGE